MTEFEKLFKCGNHSQIVKCGHYLEGLFHECKSNIERMEERVPDSDYQKLQYFISESPWDAFAVMDQVSLNTYKNISLVGAPIGFIFDECGWEKNGTKSVGVSRQYIGNVGKVCNSQLGVFGALCSGDKVALAQGRLFLPESWTKDKKRCLKAGIPEDKIVYKTKGQLCVEILEALPDSVVFDWVGGDSIYGNSPDLRHYLEKKKLPFVMDVGSELGVYLEHPQPFIPSPKGGRGRQPKNFTSNFKAIQIKNIVKQIPNDGWTTITHRTGTKGPMVRKVHVMDIYLWSTEFKDNVECLKLIFSTELDGSELKYSVCYNPTEVFDPEVALYRQMGRYWVERAFQNVKEQLGIHQYQVRSWKSWYHHIALTMMALGFILQTQIENKEEMPLLSCADVKMVFANSLLSKLDTPEGLEKAIKDRHKLRQKDLIYNKT